jgi:beta-mannosidase
LYRGAHPVEPLHAEHAGFTVTTAVHVEVAEALTGSLVVRGAWDGITTARTDLTLSPGVHIVNISIWAKNVSLWWPCGAGGQYKISATFVVGAVSVSTRRQVGFRTIAIVTGNDTDAVQRESMQRNDGSARFGHFWRVNGAAIYARGANKVPGQVLEGRYDANAIRRLVRTACDGGMNLLRIWCVTAIVSAIFPVISLLGLC